MKYKYGEILPDYTERMSAVRKEVEQTRKKLTELADVYIEVDYDCEEENEENNDGQ